MGQFTYADVAGSGVYEDSPGWKVTGVLGPDEAREPVDRTVIERATRALAGFTAVDLPLLPTADELDGLPRRLRLVQAGPGVTVLAHQSSAGFGHHQRPTWFAHGLLLKTPPDDRLGRPGELWAHPGWLRPTDRVGVETARLTPGFGERPPDRDQWSPSPPLVPLMLALLENALGGNGQMTRIAVIDTNGAETAHWVRYLGRFVSRGAAWSVPFSTFEQAYPPPDELLIVGLPEMQRPLGPEWVVVDPGRPPPFVPGPDAGWLLADGRWLRQGQWGRFAADLAADLGARRVQDLIDEKTAWTGSSAVEQPLWALPAAVLLADPSLFSSRSPQRRAAATLAESHWPEQLRNDRDRRAALSAALIRSHPEPSLGSATLLRAADRDGHQPAGSSDAILQTYIDALFTTAAGGGWPAEVGPLPWLPLHVEPGPELREKLLSGLPPRVASVAGSHDAVGLTRMLTVIITLAQRWSGLDHPAVSMQVAPGLADAIAETLIAGVPVIDGRWPLLPSLVAAPVARLLTRALEQPASRDLVVAALHWLDAQYGPVDLDRLHPGFVFVDALDVARIAALGLAGRTDRDVASIRAAQAIRRSNRVPGHR